MSCEDLAAQPHNNSQVQTKIDQGINEYRGLFTSEVISSLGSSGSESIHLFALNMGKCHLKNNYSNRSFLWEKKTDCM